jgi:hypothetical protein
MPKKNAERIVVRLLAGAMLVCAALGAHAAADCDRFGKRLDMMDVERAALAKLTDSAPPIRDRVIKNPELCLAARKLGNDLPYFAAPDASCFQNAQAMNEFTDQIGKLNSAAGSVAGLYCTDEELNQPVTSAVESCAGSSC